jgi:hypothetical protein
VKEYRTKAFFVTSHLKTWRYNLIKVAPLQSFIEYHYDPETHLATPGFYTTAVDHAGFTLLELAGN